MQARHLRGTLLTATGVCLALLLVQGCGGRPDTASDLAAVAADEAVDVERFEVSSVPVKRGPGLLLRTDTATGQAWTMGAMEAPKWKPLREGVAGVPSPAGSASGRYTIMAIRQTRGAATLVRTDHASGRIWRKGASSNGPWVAVPNPSPNPNPSPSARTEPKSKPASGLAAIEASAADAPEASGSEMDPAEESATR